MLVLIQVLVPLVLFNIDVGAMDVTSLPPCNFPAIYNFGDSNSATGSNRYPDAGRLLIEFMADYLKIPYVNAYQNLNTTNFQYGANFASPGASITPQQYPNGNPFDIGIQVKQFGELKLQSNDVYKQAKQTNTSRLPKPDDFSKALYTLDIGQNDLTLCYIIKLDVRVEIPNIINKFAAAVKVLYQQGARAFWIHNTAPIGCFGYASRLIGELPKTQDQNKCYTFMNEMSNEYNRQLKEKVNKLKVELPEAALTYVDLYTPVHELLTTYNKLGLENPTFDGIHRIQSANQWLANRVVNGSMSDPPIPITHACHKRVGA
ncbi:hypothetical protein ACSBR2_037347 [Camellia fascicularis]